MSSTISFILASTNQKPYASWKGLAWCTSAFILSMSYVSIQTIALNVFATFLSFIALALWMDMPLWHMAQRTGNPSPVPKKPPFSFSFSTALQQLRPPIMFKKALFWRHFNLPDSLTWGQSPTRRIISALREHFYHCVAVVKPWNPLVHGLQKIPTVLFGNVVESILRIRDWTRLDVHLLFDVSYYVQALDASRLTTPFLKRMTGFIVLLFVGDPHQLIMVRHKVVNGTDWGKARKRHRYGEKTLKMETKKRNGTQQRKGKKTETQNKLDKEVK